MTVIVASAIGVLTILGVWMLSLGGILIGPREGESRAPSAAIVEIPRPDDPAECRRLALEVWTRFVEAPDLGGKVREVRNAKRVGPLMRDYHERRGHPFPTMAKISRGEIAASAAREAMLFVVEPFSGPDYAVALEWNDGRYRIDWESLVAYGTADWYEFTERKSGTTERMRVFLSPLKDRWDHPALPPGGKSYLMEHRDYPDPVVVVSIDPESERVGESVVQPRTPARVQVRWEKESGHFRLVGAPETGWCD